MQIEITTIKKKISASLVMQMPMMNCADANYITSTTESILGYVTIKGVNYAICRGPFDYVKLNISKKWYPSENNSLLAMFNNSYVEFTSSRSRDEWIKNVELIKKQASAVHIYL